LTQCLSIKFSEAANAAKTVSDTLSAGFDVLISRPLLHKFVAYRSSGSRTFKRELKFLVAVLCAFSRLRDKSVDFGGLEHDVAGDWS
jgi:hypothetical protein